MLPAVWLALSLAACTGPGALSHTALGFNETVARAADSQLLLNIVRAANRNPTHYTAVTQVRDSRNVQGSASILGSVPFGPDATQAYSLSPSLTASGGLAPSFDVAPLDNRAAAEGLFHPIEARVPLTYWQQNWPPMVLLFIFADDVTVNPALQRVCGLYGKRVINHRIDNAAYSVEQFAFVRKLFECIAPHLYFEPKNDTTVYLKDTPAPPAAVLRAAPELDKGDFDFKQRTLRGRKVYTLTKTTKGGSLVLRFGAGHGVSTELSSNGRSKVLKASLPAISFDIRSVDGIVYYLGELVRLQETQHRAMTYTETYKEGGRVHREEKVLFDVREDVGADPARNITAGFLGKRYTISRTRTEDDRSLTVLALLEQVFALYREEKELPKTSAVEVVGTR